MAIDTAANRRSAVMTRRLPWFRRFQPAPDGSVEQPDRQQLAFVYRGIEPADAVGYIAPPYHALRPDQSDVYRLASAVASDSMRSRPDVSDAHRLAAAPASDSPRSRPDVSDTLRLRQPE